jgi:hypothetical protein
MPFQVIDSRIILILIKIGMKNPNNHWLFRVKCLGAAGSLGKPISYLRANQDDELSMTF